MKIFALCCLLWLICAAPVTAHDGPARLELNVAAASPGATIDLRVTGFEPNEAVAVLLIHGAGQQIIGTLTTDANGEAVQGVQLPAALDFGAYEVRVVDSHHVISAPLQIVPDPNLAEEGGQRDEDETLLAPLPTSFPGDVRFAPAVAVEEFAPVTAQPDVTVPTPLAVSTIIAALGVVGGLLVLSRRYR